MTDYSLDLDGRQILFQPLPSSQVFEVCQIIKEDSILLITFLISNLFTVKNCVHCQDKSWTRKQGTVFHWPLRKWNRCGAFYSVGLVKISRPSKSNILVLSWQFLVDFFYSQQFLFFFSNNVFFLHGNEDG